MHEDHIVGLSLRKDKDTIGYNSLKQITGNYFGWNYGKILYPRDLPSDARKVP